MASPSVDLQKRQGISEIDPLANLPIRGRRARRSASLGAALFPMSSPAQTRILAADLDHIIEHIRPLEKDLQGARIFITGGTGFIGSWLLESLAWANEKLDLGMEALVLTRNAEAYAHKAPHLAERKDI